MGQKEFDEAVMRIDGSSLAAVSIFHASPLATPNEAEVVWLLLKLYRDMIDRLEAGDHETAHLRSVQIGDLLDAMDPGDWRTLLLASLNLYSGLWGIVAASMTEEQLDAAAVKCGYGEGRTHVE
jgi:hypothetical protein